MGRLRIGNQFPGRQQSESRVCRPRNANRHVFSMPLHPDERSNKLSDPVSLQGGVNIIGGEGCPTQRQPLSIRTGKLIYRPLKEL